MSNKGIYIYGIVPNFYDAGIFRSLENSGIYAIPFQNISAIVSDRENSLIDYSDRETLGHLLIHHQQTIEDLVKKGFTLLLPMRLGTITNSKEEVLKILSNGHELIVDSLKKIQFLTEIDLAVTWADFSDTLRDIASHPDIIELKDEIMKKAGALSQLDQMKVGMLVESKLKDKNKKFELNILDSLSAVSLDIITHDVMNDQMITNSAFLINKTKEEKFEKIIDQLDEEYKGLLNFKLVGPLPCYSFYTLEVKALNPELVLQAKKELGIRDETSETEIKKVYLEKAKLLHPDAQVGTGYQDDFARINKAYHVLIEYFAAARQSAKESIILLTKEKVNENLILVKIKK